jgi:hypothetical protein
MTYGERSISGAYAGFAAGWITPKLDTRRFTVIVPAVCRAVRAGGSLVAESRGWLRRRCAPAVRRSMSRSRTSLKGNTHTPCHSCCRSRS